MRIPPSGTPDETPSGTPDETPAGTPEETPAGPPDELLLSTDALDFGMVLVGSSDSRILTVTNVSYDALTISAVLTDDGDGVFGLMTEITEPLVPSSDLELELSFTPSELGEKSGTLEISSSESGLTLTVALSGIGADSTQFDYDEDGFSPDGGDCDDANAEVYPGAPELCDGLDNDCNLIVDDGKPTWYLDEDGDGYGVDSLTTESCDPGDGYALYDGDCDDADAEINPGMDELCNGIDDNCDGQIDEGLELLSLFVDEDGDGYGSSTPVDACDGTPGTSMTDDDCNDEVATAYPGATEICDGIDSDCDGEIDEDGSSTYYVDADDDGHGDPNSPVTACDSTGLAPEGDDCNDSSPVAYPGAEEVCDNQDNDCDGMTDEDVQKTFYEDYDEDGFGNSDSSAMACTAPTGHVADGSDCNDTNAEVNPNAIEVCNGIDDNCDTVVDENLLEAFYPDMDGDGFGQDTEPVFECGPPENTSSEAGDCDDTDELSFPGATEICDTRDNDCDTLIDEDVELPFYLDEDGDGYGIEESVATACTAPDGYAESFGDCDDSNAEVYPGAPENCDGLDNDCNGQTDEAGDSTFYRDYDVDGYGDATVTTVGCNAQEGYVTNPDDCNDRNASINPAAEESCNNTDDNCDGQVDEGVIVTYYLDADKDGYGNADSTLTGCSSPSSYYVENGEDCDDLDAAVHPDAEESCNGIDDDCDMLTDEAVQTTYYVDMDGDDHGSEVETLDACSLPDGYAESADDCNDDNANTYEGAPEICDAEDNDCDGTVDEEAKTTYYLDNDDDGYGQTYATIKACSVPEGYAELPEDCNDNSSVTHPDAEELCDSQDNDCDSIIDEGAKTVYYYDADSDGYGDATAGLEACEPPNSKYVENDTDCEDLDASINPGIEEQCNGYDDNCDGAIDDVDADSDGFKPEACGGSDCDDSDANVNITGMEICDGIDNDCNGQTDETDPDVDFDTDSNNCGGCFVVCGEDGEGPFCNDGSCGSMPVYQHTFTDITEIDSAETWTLVAGSEFELRTKGGPLEIELNVPIQGGDMSSCRPTIDGVWAGSFEDLDSSSLFHEGIESTGYANGVIKRMWKRVRIYYDIPDGYHTMGVQCMTDGGTLSVGRSGSSALILTREYLGDNQVHQKISLTGSTTGATDTPYKLAGSDLTVITESSKLEISISLSIGNGGHAGCLEFMDGSPIAASPSYSNDSRWYSGLETTYGSWILWEHTRTYEDVTPGTHTFSIRCYNDSNTLNIGYDDMASVLIVREIDEDYYPSAQVADAYANGWEIDSGTDSKWYDLPNYDLSFDVNRSTVEITGHLDFYYLAQGSYVSCRPTIDEKWAGEFAELPFTSNEEEGSTHQYYDGQGRHGMWQRKRIYTDIPLGNHTFGYQCMSSGSGYYVGYYSVGTMMVREIDLIGGD